MRKELLYYHSGAIDDPTTIPTITDKWYVGIREQGGKNVIEAVYAPDEVELDADPELTVITYGQALQMYELLSLASIN